MKKTFSFLILLLLLVTGSPVFAADAILTIIPTFVDFGSVVVGEQKRITATITNQTNEDVYADDLISVQNSAVFSTDFVGVLPPFAVRSISVWFAPQDTGLETGQITLPGNAWVALNGQGIRADQQLMTLTIFPDAINFGSFDVGGSRTYTVTVRISGSETAWISVSLASNPSGAFSYLDACPGALTDGSCSIDVVFQPLEEGYYASNLLIHDGMSTHSISLRGKSGGGFEPAATENTDDEDQFTCFFSSAGDR